MINKYNELGRIEYNFGIRSKSDRQQTQHLKKALKFFEKAVIEEPDNNKFKDNLVATYNQIGIIAPNCGSKSNTNDERKQHYITALEYFNKAIAHNPNNKKFKIHLAATYYNLGIIESDCGSKSKSDEEKNQYYNIALDCFRAAIVYNLDNKNFKYNLISICKKLVDILYDHESKLNTNQEGKQQCISVLDYYNRAMNQDVTNEEFRANLMDKLCQAVKIEFTAKLNVNSNEHEKVDCNKVDDHNTETEKSDFDNHLHYRNFTSRIQSERSSWLSQERSK